VRIKVARRSGGRAAKPTGIAARFFAGSGPRSGQARFNASGTGGRCSPSPSRPYGTSVRSLRAGIGRVLVPYGLVVEQRVSPSAAFRKSLALLFDDESLGKDVWHIHDEGGLCTLLRLALELHDHGAIREWLAVARNTGLVRLTSSLKLRLTAFAVLPHRLAAQWTLLRIVAAHSEVSLAIMPQSS
jgi:hypothetical protein